MSFLTTPAHTVALVEKIHRICAVRNLSITEVEKKAALPRGYFRKAVANGGFVLSDKTVFRLMKALGFRYPSQILPKSVKRTDKLARHRPKKAASAVQIPIAAHAGNPTASGTTAKHTIKGPRKVRNPPPMATPPSVPLQQIQEAVQSLNGGAGSIDLADVNELLRQHRADPVGTPLYDPTAELIMAHVGAEGFTAILQFICTIPRPGEVPSTITKDIVPPDVKKEIILDYLTRQQSTLTE